MRELTYTVPPEDAGRTLGAVLLARLRLSRGLVSRLKFSGGLLLDGFPAHTGARLRAGQVVCARLTDAGGGIAPCDIPLIVAYRDADLLIVDKPAPLPCVSSPRKGDITLENAVFSCLGCPAGFVYRPVSRLDKGTSGLMAVALHANAHDRMQRQLHTPGYVRQYLAVTEGAPAIARGVITLPLYKPPGSVRRVADARGQAAATHYQTLWTGGGRALVRLRLETGRTHQIRAHLAALGCPVAGDYLYGAPLAALPGRFALHASRLACLHPLTGAPLAFDSPLPEALAALLPGAPRIFADW